MKVGVESVIWHSSIQRTVGIEWQIYVWPTDSPPEPATTGSPSSSGLAYWLRRIDSDKKFKGCMYLGSNNLGEGNCLARWAKPMLSCYQSTG
ncbi:hypothetical protein O181_011786 [Austropuccinia psidii MF-1]|uniref:Uncharacterized protein n=1 Tax=Austropuccinia psidii MF-1 TaxID=1389203 RepID=A0A9Q3BWE8_9BASI|nr:hypothetical protein [Austropuccinia psidii MF-1]